MNIRTAQPLDALAIAHLHTKSWRATYQNALSPSYLNQQAPQERKALWLQGLHDSHTQQHVP